MRLSNSVKAVVLACLVTGAVPEAAGDLCGVTVFDDVTLDGDLTCTGDGLIVAADGIRIDLNGYTIAGSGTGAGIAVTGRSGVWIRGGTITNFAVGIRVNTSTGLVIQDIEFAADLEGIDLQAGSAGNTVKGNTFRNSATRGIMLRGDVRENEIKGNTFIGSRVGILVFGGIDNTLKENLVTGSTLAGIRFNVIATGNVVKENAVFSNAVGIDFVVTATGSATGNELKENTIAANGCGLKGPASGNTLKNNSFEGNVADACS